MRRFVFRHRAGTEIVESDLIIATGTRWAAMPGHDDPAWSVIAAGPLRFALRLTLPRNFDASQAVGSEDVRRN